MHVLHTYIHIYTMLKHTRNVKGAKIKNVNNKEDSKTMSCLSSLTNKLSKHDFRPLSMLGKEILPTVGTML